MEFKKWNQTYAQTVSPKHLIKTMKQIGFNPYLFPSLEKKKSQKNTPKPNSLYPKELLLKYTDS